MDKDYTPVYIVSVHRGVIEVSRERNVTAGMFVNVGGGLKTENDLAGEFYKKQAEDIFFGGITNPAERRKAAEL